MEQWKACTLLTDVEMDRVQDKQERRMQERESVMKSIVCDVVPACARPDLRPPMTILTREGTVRRSKNRSISLA